MKLKLILYIVLIFLTVNCVSAATITIGTNDSGNNSFPSIQEAINLAQDNDSILIAKGNYSETLTVNKQLRIYSASSNPEDVIINPDISSGQVIHVTSDNVEITGLMILGNNDNNQATGIFLDNASNSLIQNNIISNFQDGLVLNASSVNSIENNKLISNTLHGIYLINSTNNNLITNLIIENRGGLYLDLSDQNTLVNNNVSNNEDYGIALRDSNSNKLTDNIFLVNKYGLCLISSHENIIENNIASGNERDGFLLWTSRSNEINNNLITENRDSGIYFQPSCSDNILDGNTFSENLNGISIGHSRNNFVTNNTFSSNREYGIFYMLSENENNVIENNVFLNNQQGDDNLTSSHTLIYLFLILLTGTGVAYHLKKKFLLKKALMGLGILTAISLIVIVAWYFPFESGLPGNNVYIENTETNVTPINETHSGVTLSMDLNYLHKDSFLHTNKGDMTDSLPVIIQIKSSSPMNESYSDRTAHLESEEEIILHYQETNPYECTFDLESGKDYDLSIEVLLKEEFDYPHPYYDEYKWDLLGGLLIGIDLK